MIVNESRIIAHNRAGWRCRLFGGSAENGITWIPDEGHVPNAFWRWMQRLAFGNKWERVK